MKVVYEYCCDGAGCFSELMYELGQAPDVLERECGDCRKPVRRTPSRGNFATFAGSHRAEYGRS